MEPEYYKDAAEGKILPRVSVAYATMLDQSSSIASMKALYNYWRGQSLHFVGAKFIFI